MGTAWVVLIMLGLIILTAVICVVIAAKETAKAPLDFVGGVFNAFK